MGGSVVADDGEGALQQAEEEDEAAVRPAGPVVEASEDERGLGLDRCTSRKGNNGRDDSRDVDDGKAGRAAVKDANHVELRMEGVRSRSSKASVRFVSGHQGTSRERTCVGDEEQEEREEEADDEVPRLLDVVGVVGGGETEASGRENVRSCSNQGPSTLVSSVKSGLRYCKRKEDTAERTAMFHQAVQYERNGAHRGGASWKDHSACPAA